MNLWKYIFVFFSNIIKTVFLRQNLILAKWKTVYKFLMVKMNLPKYIFVFPNYIKTVFSSLTTKKISKILWEFSTKIPEMNLLKCISAFFLQIIEPRLHFLLSLKLWSLKLEYSTMFTEMKLSKFDFDISGREIKNVFSRIFKTENKNRGTYKSVYKLTR